MVRLVGIAILIVSLVAGAAPFDSSLMAQLDLVSGQLQSKQEELDVRRQQEELAKERIRIIHEFLRSVKDKQHGTRLSAASTDDAREKELMTTLYDRILEEQAQIGYTAEMVAQSFNRFGEVAIDMFGARRVAKVLQRIIDLETLSLAAFSQDTQAVEAVVAELVNKRDHVANWEQFKDVYDSRMEGYSSHLDSVQEILSELQSQYLWIRKVITNMAEVFYPQIAPQVLFLHPPYLFQRNMFNPMLRGLFSVQPERLEDELAARLASYLAGTDTAIDALTVSLLKDLDTVYLEILAPHEKIAEEIEMAMGEIQMEYQQVRALISKH